MRQENYTSLATSKQLKEWGCMLKSEFVFANAIWSEHGDGEGEYAPSDEFLLFDFIPKPFPRGGKSIYDNNFKKHVKIYPAYDILNDICCRYADKFFPEWIESKNPNVNGRRGKDFYCQIILGFLQQGRKTEAEQYFLDVCLFNPKNQ